MRAVGSPRWGHSRVTDVAVLPAAAGGVGGEFALEGGGTGEVAGGGPGGVPAGTRTFGISGCGRRDVVGLMVKA